MNDITFSLLTKAIVILDLYLDAEEEIMPEITDEELKKDMTQIREYAEKVMSRVMDIQDEYLKQKRGE